MPPAPVAAPGKAGSAVHEANPPGAMDVEGCPSDPDPTAPQAAAAAVAPSSSAVTAQGGADEYVEEGDVTPSRDGGVVKEVIVKGKGWQRAEAGDEVTIMYKGSLLDGTVFDSSYERGSPFQFKLGSGSVIQGWELVARTMAKGEKSRVTMSAEYAYGAAGSPPKIPPNATLVFEMELVHFFSKKDVMGDGSVFKTELSSGTGWERPSALSSVSLSVVAVAFRAKGDGDAGGETSHQFMNSKITCTLGANQMPEAWEKVVPDMKKDSKLLLSCTPPRLTGAGIDGKVELPSGTTRVEYTITLNSWIKVEIISSDDSSVIKHVLVEGDGWERPNEGASVVVDVSYAKALPAASVLTSKANPDPVVVAAATAEPGDHCPVCFEEEGLAFSLGDGTVVDGLDIAIQSMKQNETARVTIVSEMAFGSAPSLLLPDSRDTGAIAPADPISATVRLVAFEKSKDMWSMSFEEKTEEMMKRKMTGNQLFNDKRLFLAIKAYERGIALFDSPTSELTPAVKKRVNVLLVQCHLNLAACFERKKDVEKVVHHCKKALEVEPSNVKALYRRGSAFIEMDDYYNAESDLKYALELSPSNGDVQRKLGRLSALKARQDAKEKQLYSNLFGRLTAMEEADKRRNRFKVSDEGDKAQRGNGGGVETSDD